MGNRGYWLLCALSSHILGNNPAAGHPNEPLDWVTLQTNQAGLICITGGRRGWIERFIRAGQVSTAARIASRLAGLFEDRCYLSFLPDLSGNGITQEILHLGQRFGLPPVAVQPIFCLKADDMPQLRTLTAIDHNLRRGELRDDQLPAMGDPAVPLFWPTREDLLNRYQAYPEALDQAAKIAKLCEPGLPDGRPIWPVLPLKEKQTPEDALKELAIIGLADKYPAPINDAILGRLDVELQAINDHGFAPLFLIVADIVRFAREQEIPVNTRGSVANSLVAFAIGITNVDPINHDLYFERFLNPARSSMPDIDLDFCSRRRDEVLAYLRTTYGEKRMALVATVNTLRLRSAIRETAKAYGFSEAQIKKLTSVIPRSWHPDPRRRKSADLEEIVANLESDKEREVVRAAYKLVGQPHHMGVHPGGIILTPGPLTDVLPVQMAPKGFLITQFDYRDVEAIGLPKIDLLGIRALTVLADATTLVQKDRDQDFLLPGIPLDDPTTGNLLQKGNTIGVFQCESSGARRTLRQLKAKNIDDLAVANAFFKPGPATGGMAKTFVRRYRGDAVVAYLHPALEPILKSTKGVLLFQEQILRIAREIAGLSWTQADGRRKGMSKFQADEMGSLENDFIIGCRIQPPEGPGFSADQAKTLWEQVLAFAGYGFNKGHATAYADISFRSAYLKAHYPAEFFCARLANSGGFHHPAIYIAEAVRLGISVKPPHINASDRRFTLSYGAPLGTLKDKGVREANGAASILWMGLGQVRGLRKKTIQNIVAERRHKPFTAINDFLARIPLQEKELKHLLQCGALDGLGESRLGMLAQADRFKRAGSYRQLAFDFDFQAAFEPDTVRDRFEWEKTILDMPISCHPLDLVQTSLPGIPLRQLANFRSQKITIRGTRLPGWTGGPGFYFGDGDDFVVVVFDQERRDNPTIKQWLPYQFTGYWREDDWGGGWFQAQTANNWRCDRKVFPATPRFYYFRTTFLGFFGRSIGSLWRRCPSNW